jgi:hypothetical protein
MTPFLKHKRKINFKIQVTRRSMYFVSSILLCASFYFVLPHFIFVFVFLSADARKLYVTLRLVFSLQTSIYNLSFKLRARSMYAITAEGRNPKPIAMN